MTDVPDRIWAWVDTEDGTVWADDEWKRDAPPECEIKYATPYLRSTPARERAEENEKHIEMLESLLLRIIDKHDSTLRNNQKALGMGFVSEVPEVVDARRYLATIKAEAESGDQG